MDICNFHPRLHMIFNQTENKYEQITFLAGGQKSSFGFPLASTLWSGFMFYKSVSNVNQQIYHALHKNNMKIFQLSRAGLGMEVET